MTAPSFVTGDIPTASHFNQWMVDKNIAVKTADEQVVSSSTVQIDNHLILSCDANTSYEIRMFINCTSASATPGIAYRLTGPAGASFYGYSIGPDMTASAATGAGALIVNQRMDLTGSTVANNARYGPILIHGMLQVFATAGQIGLYWAQQVSNATATTVQNGSFFVMNRML